MFEHLFFQLTCLKIFFFLLQELLGVASNRVIRMDLNSGDSLQTWRYNLLVTWHVNWENETVILQFEDDKV
jgi:kindlin 2